MQTFLWYRKYIIVIAKYLFKKIDNSFWQIIDN